jgi:hypothetical protein
MFKRYSALLAVIALLMMFAVPAAFAGPKGADRPFKGAATGSASYGFTAPDGSGAGTDGLANVMNCNVELDVDDYYKVTTFTTGYGDVSHLGESHLEFAHCPGPVGPYSGQMAIVAANGDVLYGEYTGTYEDDGVHIDVEFMSESSSGACHLLNDVPCESTGRFEGATGEASMIADAVPGDESDPFVPWPWWADWAGTLSY